jgi:hypothetical protein
MGSQFLYTPIMLGEVFPLQGRMPNMWQVRPGKSKGMLPFELCPKLRLIPKGKRQFG